MAKSKQTYVCRECGFESGKWMGQCPECHAWNTLEEKKAAQPLNGSQIAYNRVKVSEGLKQLNKVSIQSNDRIVTGMTELNRVLGGGLVRDSITIIAARPGAGKSTLLLQAAQDIAKAGYRVLYVSGEESESQLRRRAARILNEIHENIWVHSTSHLNEVLTAIDELDPTLIILDSIQTFFLDKYPSRPGSPTQVLECTNAIMKIAKNPNHPRAVLMAGQLTKEDELAGVRALEHMVDTVLYMEADPAEELRTLSATKNRFGSTGEMGFFTMEEGGLQTIDNPSRYFMTKRDNDDAVTGTALSVIKEGTRPMITEIESLISQSFTPYPSRIAECMKRDQLATLISILEQRGGIALYDKNVVVKTTGGLKLNQQSVNLAVIMSLVSSALKKSIPSDTVFIGDVGLTGEIKKVPSIDAMVREIGRMGFKRLIVPKDSIKLDVKEKYKTTEFLDAATLTDAIRIIFGDYKRKF